MTRQARWGLTSLPPLWRPTGQLRRLHTQLTALWRVDDGCLPSLLQSIDGICSLFSAVVRQSLWRRESHSPSLLSANTPNGCCWTLDRDNRPPVRYAPLPNVASSTSPQKPPTTYTWVDDFRPHKDSLFGGRLIRESDLYAGIYGNHLLVVLFKYTLYGAPELQMPPSVAQIYIAPEQIQMIWHDNAMITQCTAVYFHNTLKRHKDILRNISSAEVQIFQQWWNMASILLHSDVCDCRVLQDHSH